MVTIEEKKLGRSGAWGQYKEWLKKIEIDPRLVGKKRLYIEIHEFNHHIHPDWSETKVIKFSRLMANFIWEMDHRKIDNRTRQPKS